MQRLGEDWPRLPEAHDCEATNQGTVRKHHIGMECWHLAGVVAGLGGLPATCVDTCLMVCTDFKTQFLELGYRGDVVHMCAKLEQGVTAAAMSARWRQRVANNATESDRNVAVQSFLQKHAYMPWGREETWMSRMRAEVESQQLWEGVLGRPVVPHVPTPHALSHHYLGQFTKPSLYEVEDLHMFRVPLSDLAHGLGSLAFHGKTLLASGTGRGDVMVFCVQQHGCPQVGLCPGNSMVTNVCFDNNPLQREIRLAVGRDLSVTRLPYDLTGAGKHEVEVWSLGQGGPTQTWGSGASDPYSRVTSMEFDRTSKMLMSGHFHEANEVRIWDAGTGVKLITICDPDGMNCASFSLDGETIVTGGDDEILVWDIVTGGKLKTTSCADVLGGYGKDNQVSAVAVSPDNCHIVSGHETGRIQVWGAKHHTQQEQVRIHTFYSGCRDKFGRQGCFSNTRDCARVDSDQCPTLAFNYDGSLLASGHASGKIVVWNMWHHPPTPIDIFVRHRSKVLSLVFNADGNLLASRSEDGTLKIWNLSGCWEEGEEDDEEHEDGEDQDEEEGQDQDDENGENEENENGEDGDHGDEYDDESDDSNTDHESHND